MTTQQTGPTMSGAQSLIRSLEAAGTRHIFGIPEPRYGGAGGHILWARW